MCILLPCQRVTFCYVILAKGCYTWKVYALHTLTYYILLVEQIRGLQGQTSTHHGIIHHYNFYITNGCMAFIVLCFNLALYISTKDIIITQMLDFSNCIDLYV